ncbi:MAG: hypothetical protein WKF71_10870 [Pyrinomonadaceae bacterium]
MDFFNNAQRKNINAEDLGLIHLTDSPKDAVDFIIKCCGFDENGDGNNV